MSLKRMFSVFLVVVLLLSLCSSAFAVGANVYGNTPEYISPEVRGITDMDCTAYDGNWDTVCGIVDMYLPSSWTEKPKYENEEDGTYLVLAASDMATIFMLNYYSESKLLQDNGLSAEKTLNRMLQERGGTEVVVNGLCGVLCAEINNDHYYLNFNFQDETGGLCAILLGADGSSEADQSIVETVLDSICPAGKGGFGNISSDNAINITDLAAFGESNKKPYPIYDKISIDLTCNGYSQKSNDVIGATLFKQYIEEQSDGAITVTIYNNDQLAGGDMSKGLSLVKDGTVQMDIHTTSILSSIDNSLLVSCLPWTFSSYQDAEDAFFGAGGEYVAKVLAEHGLTYLGALHNGFKCMTSSKCQITSPADLAGQKIRTPGGNLWNGFWSALGASPRAMSWAEVYTAMQQGIIDGHDNSPFTINSANIQEVQKYITVSNHTYEAFTWTANTAWLESLSADTQELIKSCAKQACLDANDIIEASTQEILDSWTNNEIYVLSTDEIEVFKETVAEVIAQFANIYGKDACEAFNIAYS